MNDEKTLQDAVTETVSAVSDWKEKNRSLDAQARDLDGIITAATTHREDKALSALLGDANAKAAIAKARAQQYEAEQELADIARYAKPAAAEALAAAEIAAQSARGALARHQAEIEMRRRIGIAAKIDAAIAALAAALKEFDAAGSEIASLDVLPRDMFGSSSISRTEEIAGSRRIRAALPKSFLRYYPGALLEERPAMSLEASETAVWSLPDEPAAKAA
jgi:hypothetical protein